MHDSYRLCIIKYIIFKEEPISINAKANTEPHASHPRDRLYMYVLIRRSLFFEICYSSYTRIRHATAIRSRMHIYMALHMRHWDQLQAVTVIEFWTDRSTFKYSRWPWLGRVRSRHRNLNSFEVPTESPLNILMLKRTRDRACDT